MNIELIISFMRIFMYLNRKIKLMILSATIEEDEQNYINFFRDQNLTRVHLTFSRA